MADPHEPFQGNFEILEALRSWLSESPRVIFSDRAGFRGVAQPQGTVERGVHGAPGVGKATVAVCEDAFSPRLLDQTLITRLQLCQIFFPLRRAGNQNRDYNLNR